MYNTGVFVRRLLVIGLAGILATSAFAENEPAGQDRPRTTPETYDEQNLEVDKPEAGAEHDAMLHRANKLIGKDVKNAQDEDLGNIHDLVLTADHQKVAYAVLSHGGFWGMGSKLFAIPWEAINVGSEGDIVLAISKDQLGSASGFDKDKWPAQGDTQWLSATSTSRPMFGRTAEPRSPIVPGDEGPTVGTRPGRTTTPLPTDRTRTPDTDTDTDRDMDRDYDRTATPSTDEDRDTARTTMNREIQHRRVTHLTGLTVKNNAGEDIGDVEDFVIDVSEGRIAYTVISFGGFWGIGEKYAAVPASAVTLQPRQDVARLDATRQTLEAVAFESGSWPDLADRSYAQRLHDTFNAEPYWSVFGYVSPEEQQAAAEKAWGPEGAYSRSFNAENITTVTGTVQSVGTFHPEGAAPGAAEGIRLRITTDDGNLVTVHAGPRDYLEQHRFYVKPGDKITVTGSNTKVGWRSVLIATEIKANERTFQLRDQAGKPLWNAEFDEGPAARPAPLPRPGTTGEHPQNRTPNPNL